ncbi:MAG: DUF4139 domain-containing protein [Gammaproteobacteria bacterium]|nr:DUF4139 domain-containing protein [Gammaproteobacteria bacterium]
MKFRKLSRAAATAALACLAAAAGRAAQPDESALTIYSSQQPGAISADFYRPVPGGTVPPASSVPGYAMVRQDRDVQLAAGRSTLRFGDVAGLIDPTTVTFGVPAEPAVRVLEQNFQFDLVSTPKLLLRYLDREITVERNVGNQVATVTGTLLSAADGLVLRSADGSVHALNGYSAVKFPQLPGGLITQPTLVWDLYSPAAGTQRARVTYQTGGITWWADYNVVFNEGRNPNQGLIDLSAWVSVINQSGATYKDARLKLVAGDVNRVQAPAFRREAMAAAALAAPPPPGFAEKAFDEFHLYTLGHTTTLPNNSTKQIELFDRARQIPARRLLVYDALGSPAFGAPFTERNPGFADNTKVDTYLEFRNDAASGLGVPLPAGRVRVSRLDSADGSLEFVGEDAIDHTPKDEDVRLRLGSAFDVVGKRRQVDYRIDSHARWLEEEIEITLRNHKAQPVEVQVREPMYRWSNWKVLQQTQDHVQDSARLIHFNVTVPKDGTSVLRYRVRYNW